MKTKSVHTVKEFDDLVKNSLAASKSSVEFVDVFEMADYKKCFGPHIDKDLKQLFKEEHTQLQFR